MSGLLTKNSILSQAEAAVEKGVHPAMKQAYQKVVTAALKIALAKGPNGLLGHLRESADPIKDVVQGALGILGVLRQNASGTMPVEALVPAGMTVVLNGLSFLEQSKIATIGKTELDTATQMYLDAIMQKLGITPEKMQKMAAQTQGLMDDPAKVAELKKYTNMGEEVPNGAA